MEINLTVKGLNAVAQPGFGNHCPYIKIFISYFISKKLHKISTNFK